MGIFSLIFMVLFIICPGYKVKKFLSLDIQKRILFNAIGCIIAYIISLDFLIFYLNYFILTEAMYFVFEEYKFLEIFDKIAITSIAMSLITLYMAYLNRETLFSSQNIKAIISLMEQRGNGNRKEILASIELLKQYFWTIVVFPSVFVPNMFIYALNKKNKYKEWELSYLWIILYIILFFVKQFFLPKNFFIVNGLEIIKFIFTIYGMKTFYKILCQRFQSEKNILFHMISIFVTMTIPMFSFILGVFSSFNKDFLNIIKFKGDK